MLSERQRHPNLASCVLGLVLRRLSADWQGHWGPPVLMVESFVDESADRGTCYRAGGFQAVGVTAGFPRARRDFYAAPGQPKQLYLRQLQAGVCRRLRQARWSQAWTAYEAGVAGPCPFRAPALEDLLAGLSVLPDARSGHGLGHRQRLVLATAAVCTLNGCLRLSQHPPEVRATPAPGLGVSAQPRELGGDYLFGLKGHQSGILDQAQRLPAQQGFPPQGQWEQGRDRLERRRIARAAVRPAEIGRCGCWQIIAVQRAAQNLNQPAATASQEVGYYASSLAWDERAEAAVRAAIRGHWSGRENGTPYRRDVMFAEADCRTASRPGAAALASLRKLAIGLYELQQEGQRTKADSLRSWCQPQTFTMDWPLLNA